jgi:hypothetical protein
VAPPEGTSVCWVVDGPVPISLALAMSEGRARPLERAPTTPTVRFDIDDDAFWRLGCGRTTADQVLSAGSVRVSGDAALGRRVLEAMPFMV